MSFLKKVEADIAEFLGDLGPELKTFVLPVAIEVTNITKEIGEFDQADIIGKLVAGPLGATAEDKIRAALDVIVPKLQLAQTLLSSGDTNTILVGVLKLVNGSSQDTKTAFWIEFAAKLTAALQSGITLGVAYKISQWFYANNPALQASSAPSNTAPVTTAPATTETAQGAGANS